MKSSNCVPQSLLPVSTWNLHIRYSILWWAEARRKSHPAIQHITVRCRSKFTPHPHPVPANWFYSHTILYPWSAGSILTCKLHLTSSIHRFVFNYQNSQIIIDYHFRNFWMTLMNAAYHILLVTLYILTTKKINCKMKNKRFY